MLDQIKQDAIAGHKSAIYIYTEVINDLIPLLECNPLVNTLVNQYLEEIKNLSEELKEMKSNA